MTEITKTTKGLSLPSFAYSPPNFTDIECIDYIRYLPNYIMTHQHGIFLEATSLEEEKFINVLVKNYDYLADWLEFYVLKNTSKINLITQTERKNYKPVAELSMATLRLVQEVCVFCRWLNFEEISINRWWLACEWELCASLLQTSGFTGKPSLLGARKNYELMLSNSNCEQFNSDTQIIEIHKTLPMQALEGLAFLIASNKENILFRTHLNHYKKIRKRAARQLRDSKLNPAYLDDDRFLIVGKGRARQKRIMK